MLKKFQALAKSLFSSENHTPIERWALHNANRASADDLIAAAIVESLAKNYDQWRFRMPADDGFTRRDVYQYGGTVGPENRCLVLENKTKNVTFSWKVREEYRYDSPNKYHWETPTVNGVEIEERMANWILKEAIKARKVYRKAKEAADRAKKNMEDNEKKWNLAEDLLGMKRNEFGALVPKVSVEETV
jgi:hypothetical protein